MVKRAERGRRWLRSSIDRDPPRAGILACLVFVVSSLLTSGAVFAEEDGAAFPVGRVEIRYAGGSQELVPPAELMRTVVAFRRMSDGALAASQEGAATTSLALEQFNSTRVERVHASGVRSMLVAVREEIIKRTGFGAYVVPDPEQFILRGPGEDAREGATGLTILVYSSSKLAERARTEPAPRAAEPAPQPQPQQAEPARAQPAPVQPAQTQPDRPAEPRPVAPAESQRAPTQPSQPAAAAASDPAPPAVESAPRAAEPAPAAPVAAWVSKPPVGVVSPGDVPISDIAIEESIDGEAPFSMTGFEYTYARPHPDLPPVEALDDVTVRLVRVGGGFIARNGEGSLVRLGDLGAAGPVNMYQSAIIACERAIVSWFGSRSIVGVYVVPDFEFIDTEYPIWEDYREGMTTFPLVIYAAQVSRVKTIASGERVSTEDRLNSSKHSRIAAHSPLQPWDGDGARRDLLRLDPLNTYAYRMSRHPGRRVDVAVADASDPEDPDSIGDAEVQYLIQEIKPWTAYFQLSNTGTEETDKWRERFGLVHNQLFGFDDILTLDYITSNFRESHALIGSYDFPLTPEGTVRLNLNAGWTKYKASDVGIQDERFDGESFYVGSELAVNVFQRDDFFVDIYGGARYQDIEVINRGLTDGKGQEEIFVARAGLRAERRRQEYSFGADLGFNFSLNDITGAKKENLERLGRLDPNENWVVMTWNTDLSFYLDGIGSWNPQPASLIHEIALRFSGQYAFNHRLIPNEEAVGGGLYTVRGYPESTVAGDSAVFASVEYRFHLPRALPADGNPPTVFGEPFRVAPDGRGGRPDWDLVLKAFLDMGRVINSQRLGFEENESLLSTGLGLELVIANNLSFRTDWGIVLDETGSDTPDVVPVGQSRWHFVFTVLY